LELQWFQPKTQANLDPALRAFGVHKPEFCPGGWHNYCGNTRRESDFMEDLLTSEIHWGNKKWADRSRLRFGSNVIILGIHTRAAWEYYVEYQGIYGRFKNIVA
jgi:hypothetical protein